MEDDLNFVVKSPSNMRQNGQIDLLSSPDCHMAIMASNSHIDIWPLWHQRWPLWVFSETAIKLWQYGADGK